MQYNTFTGSGLSYLITFGIHSPVYHRVPEGKNKECRWNSTMISKMDQFSGIKGLGVRGGHKNVPFIVFEKGNNMITVSVL